MVFRKSNTPWYNCVVKENKNRLILWDGDEVNLGNLILSHSLSNIIHCKCQIQMFKMIFLIITVMKIT